MILAQFGMGGQDIFSWVMWFVVMMVFFLFYPRLMIFQIMGKLERTANKLERMSAKSRKFLLKEIPSKKTKELKNSVDRFFEFFSIPPISLDPSGIVSKFDRMMMDQKDRFDYFVDQVMPKADSENKANIGMGFAGGISLYMIAKIVRHYVEIVKKTKNFQVAMVLQMQLPMIERIAEALEKGTKSLAKGEPVGDAIGPLITVDLMGKNKTKEIEKDTLLSKVKLDKRELFVLKAKGPGGRLGYPGKAIENIAKKNKIARIITIDAAAKLEGEKTGLVAEGTGVAMGGIGVERSYIEDAAVRNRLPIDSIIVKMSQEQAITPMRKSIKDSIPQVREAIKRSLKRTKQGDKIIVLGVGNTSGVGNDSSYVEKVSKWVDKEERKLKKRLGKKYSAN